ncbi:hypothetical protein BJ170DRAFT_683004 [Xylariales sp. AK1849]|nr:hypothetical protein BJ170DRAFT_683004 [Xylariales sp. AK1849]
MDDGSEFVSALYDALELDPSNVFLLERIIEAWNAVGDESMAREYATTLLQIDTTNTIAYDCLLIAQNLSKKGALLTVTDVSRDFPDEWASADKTVEQGYSSLLREARLLEEEYSIARPSGKAEAKEHEEAVSNLSAMSEGRVSTAVSSSQTLSVKEVARQVAKFPSRSQELLHEDFESVAQWATAQEPPLNKDQIRQRLFRRKDLLEAALPDSMKSSIESAMMLAERHSLAKKYVNNSTMLGEAVEDIPRGNFFVSEDNFAWDMEELAQALKVNDGVMRNPYSRNMFSESDIRKIMRHPLAQVLRPLQIAQNELKKGIRPATIDWVAKVGRIMLADQSPDAGQSRKAMDEFLAYSVTLPDSEQTTLNSLKIPARDSHTGQAFDYTIGTSVGDAKANVTCFHKVSKIPTPIKG